ncbi:hypothetical protein LTR78_004774 [Recurvomyces mirabilis]|uniref:Rrn9 domain-containing protein n=1 Tax=Recurvomyces mirabilis TaxID=574656 RepID=A0AAE0WNY0_9PEZI|nr:hypothetical protein LTR78_004774 [Recurvomyces mirabilis]KAK5157945.1 hypothetical protein LTS14_003868 [Recurvomyces mirabilis]
MASNMDEPSEPSIFGPSQASTPRPSPPPSLQDRPDDDTGEMPDRDAKGGFPSSPLPGPSKVDDANSESEDDDEDRLNKFQGLASTWYKHTADERSLATSLDQQRANDLGVHLYNTHALKARVRDPVRAAAAKPWQSKQAWIQRDKYDKSPWHPDAHWTSWPLPVTDVPRRDEGFGVDLAVAHDLDTYRKSEPWHASQDIQDELQATVLRKTKKRFSRRVWATDLTSYVERHDETEDNDGTYHTPPESLGQDFCQPSLTADDDQSGYTKVGQVIVDNNMAIKSLVNPDHNVHDHGKASTTSTQSSDANSEMAESDEGSPKWSQKPRRRASGQSKHDLGQRDWSDVLSMAALTGWDLAVIDRAAKRCADLFGETMAFRVMPETGADAIDDRLVGYRPEMVPLTDSEGEEETDLAEPELTPAYFCPFQSCARHHEAFPVPFRWREHLRRVHKLSVAAIKDAENQLLGLVAHADDSPQYFCPFQSCERHHKAFPLAYRWRRHLREAHRLSDDATRIAETQLTGYIDPTSPNNCEDSGSQHGTAAAVSSDMVGNTPKDVQNVDDDESSMLGAVHRDSFMQPITGQLARGKDKKGRRRGTTDENIGSPKKRRVVDDNYVVEGDLAID